MAEFIFKDIVSKAGTADKFEIASAATSREEIGNDVYPPVKSLLRKHKISFEPRSARQITAEDYDYYDLLIGMDDMNIKNMIRFFGDDPKNKIHKLLDFHDSAINGNRNISDPWYTGNFAQCGYDVAVGCDALYKKIMNDFAVIDTF